MKRCAKVKLWTWVGQNGCHSGTSFTYMCEIHYTFVSHTYLQICFLFFEFSVKQDISRTSLFVVKSAPNFACWIRVLA